MSGGFGKPILRVVESCIDNCERFREFQKQIEITNYIRD